MLTSILRALSLALLLAACHAPPATPIDASGGDGDGPDAGAGSDPDAGTDPDAGPGDAGPPPALPPPWRRETSLPDGVDHHTTAIAESAAGAYLYVLGGMRADGSGQPEALHAAVRRARIGADGALGPWEDEGPLPVPLAFQTIATRGRTIVLAGGVGENDDGSLGWIPFVMQATVGDDGHLGSWNGIEALDEAALHAAAVVVGDRYYVIGGGRGAASSSTAVLSVRIGTDVPDGRRLETALPAPRSHHVAAVHDGHVYVAGGFEGPPTPAMAILRAPLDAAGALGAWETVGTMAEPLWTPALVTTDDAMLLVGGGIDAGPTDRVLRLPFDAAGHVGAAEDLFVLPYPRAHVHQTPVHAGRFYSAGGRYAEGLGQASSTDVYSAPVPGL